MAVRELHNKPEALSHFPDFGPYRWFELHDRGTVYGYSAMAEREDFLEGHLTLCQWGPHTVRLLREDLDWVKEEAKRLGKTRITGIRADDRGEFDGRLFKFMEMFGFTDMHTFQMASLDIGPDQS